MLLLVGLLAILSQIVLLRELNVGFYGVELVYGLALAAWMAGSAGGALIRPARRTTSEPPLVWLIAAAALLLPVEVAGIRASRILLWGIPGAYLPFGDQMMVLLVSLMPPAAMLGLAFRWAAEAAAASGRSLARSYAVESAGACVGALAASLAFMAGVRTFTVALLTAGLVAFLLAARRAARDGARVRSLAGPVLIAAATFAAASRATDLDVAMTAWTHPGVIESRDSPYARITATRSGSQTALFLDDVLVYESEATQQEELAHVAALAHPAPRAILLLGGSLSGTDRELAKHRPARIVAIEMDRAYVELARRLASLSNVVIDDPRTFVRDAVSARFDLIIVATPQPTSGQSNRFYTRDFFGECRSRLAEGGVLAFRLDLPEHLVSPLLVRRTASVVAAARAAFPFVRALPGSSALVLASSAPLLSGAEPMVERWHQRQVSARLVSPAYLQYLWDPDRRADLDRLLRSAPAVPNSDARPVCYQMAAANWLAKFFPGLLALDLGVGAAAAALGIVVPLGVTLVLVSRRGPGVARGMLAGMAGFAGMLLETVLLLTYQAQSGALYERLGLLLLAFMLGLAVGAWRVGRLARPGRNLQSATCAALGLLGGLAAVVVSTGTPIGLAGTALLMLASGGLTAGIFASVAAHRAAGTRAIGPLYAADLAGGAAGSVLAGIVLVPSMGLVATASVVVGASVAGLLLARR